MKDLECIKFTWFSDNEYDLEILCVIVENIFRSKRPQRTEVLLLNGHQTICK